MRIINFFEGKSEPWNFEDALSFIRKNFEVKENFSFRVGDRLNSPDENQRAGLVFAYAQLMDYSFNQVKALFAEHDHFAIAMPETRQGRNILEFNKIFVGLLQKGNGVDIKLSEFPDLFDIPTNILTLKN